MDDDGMGRYPQTRLSRRKKQKMRRGTRNHGCSFLTLTLFAFFWYGCMDDVSGICTGLRRVGHLGVFDTCSPFALLFFFGLFVLLLLFCCF
jgi:hypothetical protein